MFLALGASVVVVACSKDEKSTDTQPDASTTSAPTTSPVPQVTHTFFSLNFIVDLVSNANLKDFDHL
jgi:hypothetical protein